VCLSVCLSVYICLGVSLCCVQLSVEPVVEKVKCVSCGQSEKNKLDQLEELIRCAVCQSSGLSSDSTHSVCVL